MLILSFLFSFLFLFFNILFRLCRLFEEERPVWYIINCNELPDDYKETERSEESTDEIVMVTDIKYPKNESED